MLPPGPKWDTLVTMSLDVFQVAKMLVDHSINRFEGEISIIAYYGSYATGVAMPRSDLDMFYIPVEGMSPTASRSFVVGGIAFDFWPVTWTDAQQIAKGRFRSFSIAPSILTHAKTLYARTDEDRTRFHTLQARFAKLLNSTNAVVMARRGLLVFQNATYHLENLRLACADEDWASIRMCAWALVNGVVESLALASQVTFDQPWTRDLARLERLTVSPSEIAPSIRTIATSTDAGTVLRVAARLVVDSRAALRQRQEESVSNTSSTSIFNGAYTEIYEHLQKLRAACAEDDSVRASHEAWQIQTDVSRMIGAARSEVGYSDFNRYGEYGQAYQEMGLPDLMTALNPADLGPLAKLADEFDATIRSWIKELGIELNVFDQVDELAEWLDHQKG